MKKPLSRLVEKIPSRVLLAATVAVALGQASLALGATPQQVLDWCLGNQSKCAITVDHVTGGWRRDLKADRLQTTASVFKVVTLIAYAEAVAAGRIDPSASVGRDDWARFWVGQDGGALNAAWQRLGRPLTVTVDEMVGAMIRESDNAAPDWLLDRLGGAALAGVIARYVPGHHDVPLPVNGLFVSLRGHPAESGRADRLAAAYSGVSIRGYRDEIAAAFASLRDPVFLAAARQLRCLAPPWRTPPSPCTPRFDGAEASLRKLHGAGFTRTNTRTATRLMRGILEGTLLPPAVQAIVRRHLEWRLGLPSFAAAFTRHGAKAGVLLPQDVLNWSVYMQARAGGARVAVSIFVQGAPRSLLTINDLASFAEAIVLDPAFAAAVRGAIPAEARAADLVATSVTVARAGGGTQVQAVVRNLGTLASSPASELRLVASADPVPGPGDRLLRSVSLGRIAAGATKTVTLASALPVAPGEFAVLAVDPTNRTRESTEGNNVEWQRLP